MKTLAIATLTALSFTAFAAEPAKAPAGTQNRVEATAPAKAEAPKAEEKPTKARPSNTNPNAQTEDDAVAAAIAAATPALEN